ncbi:MAG TPA: DUF2812 domain-containing protein [Bacillota bacterium]|mgnify:FL=1|nr:DUF2812 domain-containing protein [Bacillota bacterium]
MIKRVFRPFWKYNVVATEEWLAVMAEAGFLLQSVDSRKRVFVFEKGQPQKLIYRVDYSKEDNEITPTLKKEGWRGIGGSGGWRILANQNPKPALFPPRKGVIEKTRTLLTVTYILLALAGFYLMVSAMVIGAALGSDFEVEYVPAPYPILDLVPYAAVAINALFLTWIIYTFIQTKKGLAELSTVSGYSLYPGLIKADNPLLQAPPDSKKLVKATRWFWFCCPDRIAAWLESQAARGMLLTHIHKNSFYFQKGAPRKIKYFIDAHKNITNGYFDIHAQAGFTLHGDLPQQFGRAFIWSREQAETDTIPELYTDKEDRLARARRHLSISLKGAFFRLGMGALYLLMGCFALRASNDFLVQLIWAPVLLLCLITAVVQLYILYHSVASYGREKQKIAASG